MFIRIARKTVARNFAPLLLAAAVTACSSTEPSTPDASPSNDATVTDDADGTVTGGTAVPSLEALAGLWNLSRDGDGETFEGYMDIEADGTTVLYALDASNNCFAAVRGTLTPRRDEGFDLRATGPGGSVDNVVELELQGSDALEITGRDDGSRVPCAST